MSKPPILIDLTEERSNLLPLIGGLLCLLLLGELAVLGAALLIIVRGR